MVKLVADSGGAHDSITACTRETRIPSGSYGWRQQLSYCNVKCCRLQNLAVTQVAWYLFLSKVQFEGVVPCS